MSLPDQALLSPGFYKYEPLPVANLSQIDEFTTDDWAGLSILFVSEAGEELQYPHIADGARGYIPYWELTEGGLNEGVEHSPLKKIEEALGGRTHENHRPLRSLSNIVGIIATSENPDIEPWQREEVLEAFERLERERGKSLSLKAPEGSWGKEDFKKYFAVIREFESEDLWGKIKRLGELAVAQNEIEQLYVSSPNCNQWGQYRGRGGWLAQLVGLSINTGVTNGYMEQVHGVVPVIRQKDGTIAKMGETATGSLYTKNAHKKGLKTKSRLPCI